MTIASMYPMSPGIATPLLARTGGSRTEFAESRSKRLRRRAPKVLSCASISDGDDDARVTSRSDGRVLGPIHNDDLGRHGPYDRDHGRVRPLPARLRRWRHWQSRLREPAALRMRLSPRLQAPRRSGLL